MRRLINAVDYKIKEFIEEWEDGSSEIFELYLSEIKRFEPLNDEEIFQIISNIISGEFLNLKLAEFLIFLEFKMMILVHMLAINPAKI